MPRRGATIRRSARRGVLPQDQLADFDVVRYFKPVYPRLLHFGGAHPPAAQVTLDLLKPRLRGDHELTERIVRSQGRRNQSSKRSPAVELLSSVEGSGLRSFRGSAPQIRERSVTLARKPPGCTDVVKLIDYVPREIFV